MQVMESAEVAGAREDARSEVAAGWRTVAPACVAVVPLGLALGVLVVQSGLAWWWAPVLGAVVFAGSMEFLLVGLLAATAPLAQIAVSTLLVNFRHVFYAITFPMHRVGGGWWRAYSTFALTDEAYALTATPDSAGWSRARIISIQAFFHVAWVLCVAIGAGLGSLIPPQVVGLDFAVTALFVVLGIEAYKVRRSVPVSVVALACAIVAALISPANMLLIAMGMFGVAIVCSYLVSVRRSRRA
ncbi:AzlC family ABC transporter permease [Nocardioides albertanoniae]|nr:AzlC family ABC transporter permease [Nocardioides albertanoniae]